MQSLGSTAKAGHETPNSEPQSPKPASNPEAGAAPTAEVTTPSNQAADECLRKLVQDGHFKMTIKASSLLVVTTTVITGTTKTNEIRSAVHGLDRHAFKPRASNSCIVGVSKPPCAPSGHDDPGAVHHQGVCPDHRVQVWQQAQRGSLGPSVRRFLWGVEGLWDRLTAASLSFKLGEESLRFTGD